MKLYDLFEIAEWEGKADDDPIHRTVDLWRGLDVAERYLGFSLEDLALIFRYARPAAIWHLFAIGAHYAAWAADDPRIRSGSHERSEERRVGREGGWRWAAEPCENRGC